jgi:hypothetical protein
MNGILNNVKKTGLTGVMKLRYDVEIQSSPEKVWYWLGTPERAKVWQTNVSKTEILHQTANWIGTTFRETVEENGKGTEMEGVVTDYIENQVLALHLSGEYNMVDVEWHIEKQGDHTRLIVNSNIRFKSFLKILSIIIRPVFKRKITEQLRSEFIKLKKLCESDD